MIKVSKNQAIYIGVAVVIMLLLAWALFHESPVSVDTALSSRGRMTVTVDGEGKTRARVKNTITAPIAGRMTRIKLLEGDRIPHDFPIAEIDPNPPVGFPQSCPTLNRGFSRFASTKPPFVTSSSRPEAVSR